MKSGSAAAAARSATRSRRRRFAATPPATSSDARPRAPRPDRLRGEHVADRLLEGARDLGGRRGAGSCTSVQHRRLEAGEREVVGAAEPRARQARSGARWPRPRGATPAGRRGSRGRAAARPCRKPRRRRRRASRRGARSGRDRASAAAPCGRPRRRARAPAAAARSSEQPVGANVTLDVVHRDQRQPARLGERTTSVQPDHERAGQSRALRRRNVVDALPASAGVGERLAHERDERAQVLARGNLGHHAASRGVQLRLRRDRRSRPARARRSTTAAAVSSQELSMARMRMTLSLYCTLSGSKAWMPAPVST